MKMKYTVILEKGLASYGAFVPDLPGCIAAGETKEEVLQLIKEAIEFHIEGIIEKGEPVPPPLCDVTQVEVTA
jgi:predicted RNase H-like HicB family nuclease